MYNSNLGMIIGIIISLSVNLLLGYSVKEYQPEPPKRKKYKKVQMKINRVKKPKPKPKPPVEKKPEVKKVEKKPEVKKVEKKTEVKPKPKKRKKRIKKRRIKKKKPKKIKKKVEEVKPKVIPKNPIDQNKKPPKPAAKVTAVPVFGVSMSSVGSGSGGMAVQVGNTLMTESETGWENGKPKAIGTYVPPPVTKPKKSPQKVTYAAVTKIKKKAVPKKVIRPAYTKVAKDAEIEGRIILKLVIDKKGKVIKAKILKGLGFGLDEAALKAVKQFLFSPAILTNGKSAVSAITYTITFMLED